MDEVADEGVDGGDLGGPRALDRADGGTLGDAPFLADDAAQAFELLRHALVKLDGFVKGFSDFAVESIETQWKALGKITLRECGKCGEEFAAIEDFAFGGDAGNDRPGRCGTALGGAVSAGVAVGFGVMAVGFARFGGRSRGFDHWGGLACRLGCDRFGHRLRWTKDISHCESSCYS